MGARAFTDCRASIAAAAERIAVAVSELSDFSIATLHDNRLGEPAKPNATTDQVGALSQKAADALKASAECLVKLCEIPEPEPGPQRPDQQALPPFAETLAAIRRARKEVS